MADNNSIGISLVIKAVDQGSAILAQMSAALEKIGISATSAGGKADAAGNQIKGAFSTIPDHLDKMNKSVERFSDKLASVGATLTGMGAAITAPMGLAVKTAADFENEMNKLQAFGEIDVKTDAGQKELKALSDKARELAKQFTAPEIAAGMGELIKAGLKTEEVLASIGPALNLAFTEGRSMKDTAEDLVKVLASFGMGADQAGRATDVLSKTSLATTTSMSGLVEGLKYVASMANNVGMNIEETTAYLGIFAQNGVDASMAGTGLRRILGDLSNPTKDAKAALANLGVEIAKNEDGSVNLTKTFEALNKAGLSTANAFKIFGDQGGNVAITATKNIDAIKKLTVENENAKGSLDKVVSIINKGLGPAWKNFTSALGEVAIALAGPFLESLKGALDQVSAFLRGVSEFSKAHPIITQAITAIVASFGLFVTAAGTVTLGLAGLTYAAKTFGSVLAGSSLLSLGSSVAAIIPSWTALTAAIGSVVSVLGTAGTAIAAFASGPVAIIAAAVAAIVGAVAGGYKILSDRAEAAAVQAETLKRSQADLRRAVAEGFDPSKQIKGVGSAALTTDPYVDLVAKRKQAVVDFVGVNEQLTQAREKDAQSILGGKSAQTKQLEESVSLARQNIDLIQTEINSRLNQKAAVAAVGKEQEKIANVQIGINNLFTDAAKSVVGLDDKLKVAKDTLDTVAKSTEYFYSSLNNIADIRLGNLKNEIEATSASEKVAATEIARVESSAALDRIQNTRAQYAELKKLREDEHVAALSFIDAELAKAATDEKAKMELNKKRSETEKAFRDKSLQDEQKLQDGIVTEIKKQQDVVASILKQRKELEQQIREEAVAAQRAQSDVWQKSIGDIERVKVNYALAVQNLQAANALLPTMPEKAMELAKKARDEFKGLAQDVNGLKNDLVNTFKTNQELLRDMAKKTMSPVAAWKSDLEYVNKLMNEAQALMGQGKFKEAADAAAKAKGEAAKLDKVPEGAGLSQQEVSNKAIGLVAAAAGLEESAKKAGLEFAVQLNQGIQDNIGKASVTVKTAQETLLAANTKQLAINANLLEILSRQFQTMIQQNNERVNGGKGVNIEPPSVQSMIDFMKQQFGAPGTGVPLNGQQGFGGPFGGAYQGAQAGTPGIQTAAQALSNSPEVAKLLGQTDTLLAKSQAESNVMKERMAQLKYLESYTGNLDRKERAGYSTDAGQQTDAKLNSALKSLFGTDTFDFGAIQENIDSMLSRAYQQAKAPVDAYLKQTGGASSDTTQTRQFDSFLEQFKTAISETGAEFKTLAEEGIKTAFGKGVLLEVVLKDDKGGTLGSVRRIV
jgi:TP901 family phage tail tape measure protein